MEEEDNTSSEASHDHYPKGSYKNPLPTRGMPFKQQQRVIETSLNLKIHSEIINICANYVPLKVYEHGYQRSYTRAARYSNSWQNLQLLLHNWEVGRGAKNVKNDMENKEFSCSITERKHLSNPLTNIVPNTMYHLRMGHHSIDGVIYDPFLVQVSLNSYSSNNVIADIPSPCIILVEDNKSELELEQAQSYLKFK